MFSSNKCGVGINVCTMDQFRLSNYFGGQIWVIRQNSDYLEPHIRENAMTVQTHASLSAIGNQLRADYFPVLSDPLPSELKDLFAQLVALEIDEQGSTKR